ncbi:MAG: efflux transporter periplasmic adaptor subunit [Pirellulales bacterium]|nr:efflux transporter periplasmic adaptor subunit [Pirellulales bacterium]
MRWKLTSTVRRWLIVPPVILAMGLVGLLIFSREGPERAARHEEARSLRVIRAVAVDTVPRVLGYGTAKPAQVWQAVAEVKGRIIEIHPQLKAGAMLQEGEVLLRIDPVEYELAVAQFEADIAQATAQLEELTVKETNDQASLEIEQASLQLAERDLQRAEALLPKKAVAATTVDQEKRDVLAQRQIVQRLQNSLRLVPQQKKSLEATLAVKKTGLRQAELDLAKTVIKSPFDCRLGKVEMEPGQYLGAGQSLFEAYGTALTEIEIEIPLDQLRILIPPDHGFRPPMTMDENTVRGLFDFDVIVRYRSGDFEAEWKGQVVRMREQLHPRTRSVALVITVDKSYEQAIPGRRPPLLQGMYCEAELRGPVRKGKIVIPRTALHDGHVYVVGNDRRLRRRKVEAEFAQSNFLCLEEGLTAGETLVVSDPTPAIEGLLVEPVIDEQVARRLIAEASGEGSVK